LSASWRSATISGRSRSSAMSRPAVPAPATSRVGASVAAAATTPEGPAAGPGTGSTSDEQPWRRTTSSAPRPAPGGEHRRFRTPAAARQRRARRARRPGTDASSRRQDRSPGPASRASSTSSRSVTRAALSGIPIRVARVLPGAPVHGPQLSQSHGRDDAVRPAGAFEGPVVEADQLAVRREPHVALEGIGPPPRSPAGMRRRCAPRRRRRTLDGR
jgi:hypothetical protein